jgi:hypothetical protein
VFNFKLQLWGGLLKKLALFVGIFGLLGGVGGALAQNEAQPAPGVDPHAVTGVTVTAHSRDTPAREVERIGQTDGEGQLARWDSPICPDTVGLPNAFNAFVSQRILTVAQQVGASVGAKGCQPNVLIFVTPDPSGFTQKLVKLKEHALAGGRWPVNKAKLIAFVNDKDPVRWLYMSAAVQASSGGAVSDPVSAPHAAGITNGSSDGPHGLEAFLGAGALPSAPQMGNVQVSRLTPAAEQAFSQVVMVVDAKKIAGLGAGQIADYLAMVALAHIKEGSTFSGSDTILNLFTVGIDDAHNPKGLRPWDTAYLPALYKADAQKSYSGQVSHIATRMADQLKTSASGAQ